MAVPPALAVTAPPASATGIGLFDIRKKLERAEEVAAEVVLEVEVAAAIHGEAVTEAVADMD
jgi:hypothetical protein